MRVLLLKKIGTSAKGGAAVQYFSSAQITAKATMYLKSVLVYVVHLDQSYMMPVQSMKLCHLKPQRESLSLDLLLLVPQPGESV